MLKSPLTSVLKQHTSLKDGIFVTDAYGVPSKSQNPTVLCQDGPSSMTQHSNSSWEWLALGMPLAPTTTLHFDTVLKTKYSFPHWIFFAKIGLEITNI